MIINILYCFFLKNLNRLQIYAKKTINTTIKFKKTNKKFA